ncbi:hypothetical protein OAL81_04600 [Candidatus Pelagibacter sp.]|jgi:hypothetical protein|nr:hypothetical protein [Candidatus Pelagibacter sp.]|tara:strand:- start:400 stop:918 length:519 start_codon:yes stop_codon:yes gene_type:complete
MKNIKRDIDLRRFIKWSKIVKGKPINIRLYELIYVELLNLWVELGKPPLRRLIYETINSENYDDRFVRGKIFQKYIDEILETPCEDGTGYYNPDSREILNEINIKELYDVKFLIKDELNTVIMIDRYNAIYTFCRIYEKWCLQKKSEQLNDITKKERFDVTSDLPLKISTQL